MPGPESGFVLGGDLGAATAIALMGLATYLCRLGGVALMSRVRPTPSVERALRALPGSIVLATIAPLVVGAGSAGFLAVGAAVAMMRLARSELLAIAAGLAAATAARAIGL